MPQSLSNVLVHIVFSTKERRALLRDRDARDEMHRYLAGISNSLDCPATIVGGATDPVHLLANQSRTIALAEWVKKLKRASSFWAKKKNRQWNRFQWQAGYCAFSVSGSQKERVHQYITSAPIHFVTRNTRCQRQSGGSLRGRSLNTRLYDGFDVG